MNYLFFTQSLGVLYPGKTYLIEGVDDVNSQADVDARLSVVTKRLPDGTCEISNDPKIVNVKYSDVLAEYDNYMIGVGKAKCKEQAKELIAATDWAVLSDVTAKLVNQQDFVTYRATLRDLIINPVATPEFPTEPTPTWG